VILETRYQQLDHGISCIDTLLQRPGLAACYLIVQDGMAGFIDTGTNNSLPILLDVLRRKGLRVEDVAYIMPTHVHLDHAGGAGGLMQHCPNATLLVHPRGARHLIDPARLEQGSLAVYGEQAFADMFGHLQAVAAERVCEVADGYKLDFNGRELQFLDTPGHARHHYCVYDSTSRGIFTGDSGGASYPELNQGKSRFIFPPTTPVQFDPSAWRETLQRFVSLKPERIFVTHFGMHENVLPLLQQLQQALQDYVGIAEEFAATDDRENKIAGALLRNSINILLDRQCGMDTETIKSLLLGDMKLNAQGLEHWLITR
jgi:glyoxylase-like metal-dependent hydrolase (beta-lactamase superfamily II)